MYFISLTRLRIRSIRYLPGFIIGNEASIRSIKKIEGFIYGKELVDKKLTFWTVTVWESVAAMKVFRNNDPHKTSMRKLPGWCDEGSYAHWEQEEAAIPGWDILHQRLLAEGRVTKVKHPSAGNAGMNYGPPVWRKIERQFKYEPEQ